MQDSDFANEMEMNLYSEAQNREQFKAEFITFFDQILGNLEDHLIDYNKVQVEQRPETYSELYELAKSGSIPEAID